MALSPYSPPPELHPSGVGTDPPWGPLAQCGNGNPSFYHQFFDDFDQLLGVAGPYTTTSSGAGTVAHTAGDGGLALFTTGAVAGNFESIQLPAASFLLPGTGNNPPITSSSVKKVFYLTRLSLANATTSGLIAGLCATSATPFTAGVTSVLDGLYFYKAPGSTLLQFINVMSAANSPNGSQTTYNLVFATPFNFANATSVDLAFYIDKYQNVRVWAATQLFGYIPQSGSGAVGVGGVSSIPVIGPIGANYNFQAQNTSVIGATLVSPWMFTQIPLNVTLAVTNGATAAGTTGTFDFHGALKER